MSETVAAGQLRAIIERIERVEDEIKELNADKSEIYKEARGVGFDVKAIRQCVAARKLDSAEREERDAIFDLYWSALNGSSRVHMHEDRNSTAPDRNGANMENDDVDGSAAARTEASEDVVALTGQVETPTKAEMIDETASLAAREGEKPLHSFSHSSAPTSSPETTDESPAPRPNPAPGSPLPPDRAAPGEDGPPSKPSPEEACAKNDVADTDVIGQGHVRGNSGQAAPIPNDDVPAFLLREPSPAPNPDCQNPKSCRWSHSQASCAKCANDAALARQRGRAA